MLVNEGTTVDDSFAVDVRYLGKAKPKRVSIPRKENLLPVEGN